jgi:lysophospholipase L1-like esterase
MDTSGATIASMDVHPTRRARRRGSAASLGRHRWGATLASVVVAAALVAGGCAGPAGSAPISAIGSAPSSSSALSPAAATASPTPAAATAMTTTASASTPTGTGTTPSAAPTPSQAPARTYVVVAVGDSILANSPLYCPGCTGFVAKYGSWLSTATGHPVSVHDLATLGLQTSGLLRQVTTDDTRRAALRASDVVMVSVGTNDGPWRHTDDPCDGPVTLADPPAVVTAALERYTPTCATAYAEAYRSRLQAIFSTIRALHGSRPGIFLALDRYNDWIGYRSPDLPEAPELERVSPMIVRAWNTVYCEVARANGFACVDLSTRFNGPDGTQPSGDLVVADFTHPSQLGQDAILDLLVAAGFGSLAP